MYRNDHAQPAATTQITTAQAVQAMRAARDRACELDDCGAPPGRPCQDVPEADHLRGRYLPAYTAGQISTGVMEAIIWDLAIVTKHRLVRAPRSAA